MKKKKIKKEKENEKILHNIHTIVDELLESMDMLDWKVEINYAPGMNETRVADVSYSIHKEATMFVYDYRPEYVRDDLMHELFHCKLGFLSKGYQELINGQQRIIEGLLSGYEERTVDSLLEMMRGYVNDGE